MLSREQALEWCRVHLVEWPEVKPSITPDGWYWCNSIIEPSELILFTDHGKDGESLVSRLTFELRRGMYDTDGHFTVKLKPSMITKSYHNQFTPSSFSFNYLMKNVHKMARP